MLTLVCVVASAHGAPAARATDPVIAAAGDIACRPTSSSFNGGLGTMDECRQLHTSNLLLAPELTGILTLGDNQYEQGELLNYLGSYDPSWGRVKSRTFPSAGNHEYMTPGASGYYDYFNGVGSQTGPAGDRTKGYYSFDIGSWHLIALNSNCSSVGGCGVGSAQEQWLRADLAAHPNTCTLAYWHHPRFTAARYGNDTMTRPFWQALFDYQAEIVLNGHDHNYQRYAPQDPVGNAHPQGIREFVVGTGGKLLYEVDPPPIPNREVANDNTFGVLKLTLHPSSYEWAFQPEAGRTFTDSGSGSCDQAAANLALAQTDAPDPASVGGQVTYSLTATNNGPRQASSVTLNDTLPAGVSYQSASPSQGSCSQSAGTVTCNLGTLGASASATVDVTVSALSAGQIMNSASVTASEPDPDAANNTDAETTTVNPSADLSVTLTDSPDPVFSGGQLTYAANVTNNGPSPATSVAVTDTLPSGVAYQSASPSQGSCAQGAGTVTCDLGTLASLASASVQIVVSADTAGELSNQVSVQALEPDPGAGNNTATAATTVRAASYVRPKGATPVLLSLVPAYRSCAEPDQTPNRLHGGALASSSCNPPGRESGLTIGTPDVNGTQTKFSGYLRADVIPSNVSTPEDEADVRVTAGVTDVRNGDLSDYVGELDARLRLRITDRNNAPQSGGGTEPATTVDLALGFPVSCAATPDDATVGSTCTLSTTADAAQPGSVIEDQRAIWEAAQIEVFDGGADGLASTNDNELFLTQGIFVP